MKVRDDNSCEAGMEKLFAFLLETATAALEYDGLGETRHKDESGEERLSDRERLERAKAAIEKHSRPLVETVRHHPLFDLMPLFIATYDIGMIGNAMDSAKEYFRPDIESAVKKAEGKKGGKESGKARRSKAAEKWEQHALALAGQIQGKNALSQMNLASEIREGWKGSLTDCPGVDHLVSKIRSWQKDGMIPRLNRRIK